jgi:hypothetical protein
MAPLYPSKAADTCQDPLNHFAFTVAYGAETRGQGVYLSGKHYHPCPYRHGRWYKERQDFARSFATVVGATGEREMQLEFVFDGRMDGGKPDLLEL